MESSPENLSSESIATVLKQLKDLQVVPAEGINVYISEDNIAEVFADIQGPDGTPFHNGTFKMKLILPTDYPRCPPRGFFVTKIFHPNVRQPSGEICVNTLKKDWKPGHDLRHVLMVIRCLLIEPFPESALNEDAAKLMLENYDEYFKRAQMLTNIHALSLNGVVNKTSFNSTPPPLYTEYGVATIAKVDKKKSLRRL